MDTALDKFYEFSRQVGELRDLIVENALGNPVINPVCNTQKRIDSLSAVLGPDVTRAISVLALENVAELPIIVQSKHLAPAPTETEEQFRERQFDYLTGPRFLGGFRPQLRTTHYPGEPS